MATAPIVDLSRGVKQIKWDWLSTATGPSNTINLGNYTNIDVSFFGATGGTTRVLLEGRMTATEAFKTLESASGAVLTMVDVEPGLMYRVGGAQPIEIRSRASTVTGGDSLPQVHVIVRYPL